MQKLNQGLKKKADSLKDVLVNIGHTAVAKVLLMVVQFATATILARNLSADDYGVVI